MRVIYLKKVLKLVGIGFIGWLIPFIIGFIAFPLKQGNDPLFETIMPIALVCVAVFFSMVWFKKVTNYNHRYWTVTGQT